MNIKKLANSLARKHQSRNPFEVIRGMNVILLFVPLVDTKAFYQYYQRNNIIYIDETLSPHEQQFECAHELGHMLQHKKSNFIFMDTRTSFNTSKYENEADLFAMDFLVDDATLLEYHKYPLEQISLSLGYEKRLIKLRLQDFEGR